MIGLLVLASLAIAILLVVAGVAFSRRAGWPLFIPGLLALCVSMVVGCSVVVIAHFYFTLSNDHGIPWIENLGISLIVATVAFFIASACLLVAACVPSIRGAYQAKRPPNDA
jgi:hypothetical protein